MVFAVGLGWMLCWWYLHRESDAAQTQQAMSISIMKKAADQQNRMADLLARNAQQAFPPAPDSGYGFSTYA
jgi:hypothetical protein